MGNGATRKSIERRHLEIMGSRMEQEKQSMWN